MSPRKNFPEPLVRSPYVSGKNVTIPMTVEMFNEVREFALKRNSSMSSALTVLIRRGLNKKDGE